MQDVQIFCVQGVSVGKTIVQRRDRPFFREVFIFRAVKPDAKVVVLSPHPKNRVFYDLFRTVVYCHSFLHDFFPFFSFDYITTVIAK